MEATLSCEIIKYSHAIGHNQCCVRYISEWMVLIINIKVPTRMYPNCNINQILIYGGYVKRRASLFIQVIIWVNFILNHIDSRMIIPRYESSCMVYRPEWYLEQQ